MKEENLRGKLRQKRKGDPYYYRLTVATGDRKEFPLKTTIFEEAVQIAFEIDAVYEASNKEVAFAQINAIKGFTKQTISLPLSEIWNKYEEHPNRARPRTPHEPLMYHSSLQKFIDYLEGWIGNKEKKCLMISSIAEVTPEIVSGYVDYLKTTRIAVDTHNNRLLSEIL